MFKIALSLVSVIKVDFLHFKYNRAVGVHFTKRFTNYLLIFFFKNQQIFCLFNIRGVLKFEYIYEASNLSSQTINDKIAVCVSRMNFFSIIRKKAKIRNQVPHLTRDNTRQSD